jgi:hypothetical protein
MLIENSRLSEFSNMSASAEMTSGILPPLTAKSVKELQFFIVRSLVETGALVAILLISFKLLY